MKAVYFHSAGAIALTFGLGLTLAACVPSAEPPAPLPAPTPSPTIAAPPPAPPPPVVTEPVYENYLDAPQTQGTWTYYSDTSETLAIFGTGLDAPIFAVRCASGRVELGRVGNNPASASVRGDRMMSITTETTTRQLQASARSGRFPAYVAAIGANDPLLDAMAITKGRIAIGVEGERTLYLPAWVEISRVIEDCR